LLGVNSVDEFLFTTKTGYCEHFSQAFTVLMRAANIPARVVAGYQGGEFNPFENYLMVREKDAHAWVEVWIDSQGWLRVDPTAVIPQSRVLESSDNAFNAGFSQF
ncbi:MAG: transglutaminase domain-containing protein, partial [Pseudomonadales bacterium]|nr:transglutaminase domain-containing protein [Pseudomonadales bacterium]